MLTIGILGVFLFVLVIGLVFSVYYCWKWGAPAMGFLAFILLYIACTVGGQIVHVAAQIDKVQLEKTQ